MADENRNTPNGTPPVVARVADWTRKVTAFGGIIILGWLGETGADGGLIKDVWTAAKTASPFAAMLALFAWLDEKAERREAQKQCNQRTIDFITATNAAARTFETVITSVQTAAKRPRKRSGR